MSGIILNNSLIKALADLISIIPLLFITFAVIEFIEYFYFDKVLVFIKKSGKFAPLIGSVVASFPQCGFSIIASVLYIKGLISRGTLLAVYLSTSDEAIPVLLSMPEQYKLVLPVIAIKITIGIVAGYAFDYFFPQKNILEQKIDELSQKGCCSHTLKSKVSKDLILHPIVHTISIALFIFLITFVINLAMAKCGSAEALGGYLMSNSPMQPVIAALFGLIPNCAISIGLTLMLIKGTITFGALMAGLLSNAGLGLLVLLKNNDFKDTLQIIFILLVISIVSGVAINFLI